MRRPVLLTLAVAAATLAPARPAAAVFRFDELEARRFDYHDEYFIDVFSYRPRLSHRWTWSRAALGYDITAGSLRTDELYLQQRALVRLPFSNHFTGEYRYVETEDYDARYARNEVEVVARFFRPRWRLPLLDTVGNTPPPDGWFAGGIGLLDADKEFADLGFTCGYGGTHLGWRVDTLLPDFFFNSKNHELGEYTSGPYTLRTRAYADLLGGDLYLGAWVEDDLPLRLDLPRRDELTFRYRKVQAGCEVRWVASDRVRADLELTLERTRKRRRARLDPLATDDVDREALRGVVQVEVDLDPAWGAGASRPVDTLFVSTFVHLLDEETDRVDRGRDMTIGRGEVYAEVGYVLALPTFDEEYRLGLRGAAQAGFLSMRDVREDQFKHTVSRRLLAKLALGLEVGLRDGLALAFFQLTWRADNQTFGGGNAQVMMRF